jgi:hypothetical protein
MDFSEFEDESLIFRLKFLNVPICQSHWMAQLFRSPSAAATASLYLGTLQGAFQ